MILENYYTELESITSLDSWDLLKQLNPLNEKLEGELEECIIIERKILAFSINKGDLSPKTKRVDISGKAHSYPNHELFTDKEIDYIKFRLDKVANVWIKGRYSHVLWSISKNNEYAKISIDCYLAIIDSLIIAFDSKQLNKVDDYLECLLFLGEKTKIDVQTIKEKAFELLNLQKLPNYLKSHILGLALNSKLIKSRELEFVLNDILNWVELKSEGSFFLNQTILNYAILLSERLHKSSKKYNILLAENQDLIINQHPDEKDFIRYISFGEKAKFYKKACDIENYESCLQEYTRLKNKFELGRFESRLPDKETEILNEYLNHRSEIILKMPIDDILTYFASGDDLLMRVETLDNITEKAFKNSFHQFCSTSTFDINSNHKRTSIDETKENERFRNYTVYFNISVFPIIIKVFAFGIINGKISYHSVFNYLQNNSWYGQKFPRGNYDRDIDDKSTWLSLFAPGLHDYFSQLEWALIMAKDNIQNYILCIDSLTTKFEGALRDFIRLLGGTTTIEKRGELQEQLLEELLQNRIITEQFTPEDITLFKYVFTARGWNIRNNVAHCFYPYSNYSFDKATLVFLCILRLGKYKLKSKDDSKNE